MLSAAITLFALNYYLFNNSVASFAKEAETNHPELLALPDELDICTKAAGYKNLSDLHSTAHGVFFLIGPITVM